MTCGPIPCIQMQVLHIKYHTTKSPHVSKCCLLCTYFWYMYVSLVMLCLTHEVTTLCVECYKCTITSLNRLLKSCHSNQNSPSILHDPYMYAQLIWILKNVCISRFREKKISSTLNTGNLLCNFVFVLWGVKQFCSFYHPLTQLSVETFRCSNMLQKIEESCTMHKKYCSLKQRNIVAQQAAHTGTLC